jgi:hypothetical protein
VGGTIVKPIRSFAGRTWGLSLSAVYFFSNVATGYTQEKTLWTERRQHVEKRNGVQPGTLLMASVPGVTSPGNVFDSFPQSPKVASALSTDVARSLPTGFAAKHRNLFNALLSTHGTIRKVWLPSTNAGDRVVVHIEDIHQNEDAQRHIGSAVDALVKASQADVVALEGAFSPVDVKAFHDFEDREVVGLTADYLLRENKVTGPVHAFMTTTATLPPLVGVDDKAHYDANVEAYRQSAPNLKEAVSWLASQKTELDLKKKSVFSGPLSAFDAVVGAYQEGRLPLADFVAALAPSDDEGHAGLLARALKMEKDMDFNKVDQDRKAMLNALVTHLNQSQIDQLVQESLAYRTGAARYGEFYGFLKNLCRSAHVDLSLFPHMDAYIRYVMVSDQINGERLWEELSALQKDRFAKLAKTEQERSLVDQSNVLHLTDRLIHFSLTPAEWKEYQRLNLSKFPTFQAFYLHAEQRNVDLAKNLLASMEKGRATRAVLVTGGYHTAGVSERLRDAGVTVLTLTPRITTIDSNSGSAYLDIFTQEKTPLEKLFAGEKLFVSQHPGSESAMGIGATVATALVVKKKGDAASAQSIFHQLGGSVRTMVTAKIFNDRVDIRLVLANAKNAVVVSVKRIAGTLSLTQKTVGLSEGDQRSAAFRSKGWALLVAFVGLSISTLASGAGEMETAWRSSGRMFLGTMGWWGIGFAGVCLVTFIFWKSSKGVSVRQLFHRHLSVTGRFSKKIRNTIYDAPLRPDVVVYNVGSKGQKDTQDKIFKEALESEITGDQNYYVIDRNLAEREQIPLLVGGPLVMSSPEESERFREKNIAFFKNIYKSMAIGGRVHLLLDFGPSFRRDFVVGEEQIRRWLDETGFDRETATVRRFSGMVELKATKAPIILLSPGDSLHSNFVPLFVGGPSYKSAHVAARPFLERLLNRWNVDPLKSFNYVWKPIILLVAGLVLFTPPSARAANGPLGITATRESYSTRTGFAPGMAHWFKSIRSPHEKTRQKGGKSERGISRPTPEKDARQFLKSIHNPQTLLKAVVPLPTSVTGFDGSAKEIVHAAPDFIQNMAFWGHQSKDEKYIQRFSAVLVGEMARNPKLTADRRVMFLLNTLLGGVTKGTSIAGDLSNLILLEAAVSNRGVLYALVQTAEAIQEANVIIESQGGKGIRLVLTPSEFVSADMIERVFHERKLNPDFYRIMDAPANGESYALDQYVEASRSAFRHFTQDLLTVNHQYLNTPNIHNFTRENLNALKGADDQFKKQLAQSLLDWMTDGARLFSISAFNAMLEAAIFASQNA